MNNSSSLKKILILVTLLAVPGFLYYLLQDKGKNRYRPLEIFGPKQVASTFHTKRGKKIPDTIYHTIDNFKLISQTGDTISFPADTATISVVNFFFTRCRNCLILNRQMERLADEYARNRMLRFYTITADPAFDTPPVLKQYAASFRVPENKWEFLTGDKELIYHLAKNDFLIDILAKGERPEDIMHNPLFILVDPQKRIRGFYDPSSKEQVDKLSDEIKVLIAEQLRKVVRSQNI